MPNPNRVLTVEIAGQTWPLRFDVNAVAELETQVGTGFKRYIFQQQMDLAGARIMLWAGLLHAHPMITVREAGDLCQAWIDEGKKLEALCVKLFETMQLAGLIDVPTVPPPAAAPPPAASPVEVVEAVDVTQDLQTTSA